MAEPYKVVAVEWHFMVPGHPEPTHVLRRLKVQGVERFRVVTWAPTSGGRELVGYYATVDDAAAAAWRHYWLENGVSMLDVSRLLGHASYAITDRTYAHVRKRDWSAERRRISAATRPTAAPVALRSVG